MKRGSWTSFPTGSSVFLCGGPRPAPPSLSPIVAKVTLVSKAPWTQHLHALPPTLHTLLKVLSRVTWQRGNVWVTVFLTVTKLRVPATPEPCEQTCFGFIIFFSSLGLLFSHLINVPLD